CEKYSLHSLLKSLDEKSDISDLDDLVNDIEKVTPSHEESKELIEQSKEQTQESKESSKKGKRFIFTFGPKEGHAWHEYNQDSSSIHVNGKNGPVLHLYRDSTYFFCLEQKDNDNTLVLTNSPL